MTTGKSAQFSMFLGEIFEKSPVTGDFLRNKVLKIFCERDILRKLLCSKGLVTHDANTWSNFYSIMKQNLGSATTSRRINLPSLIVTSVQSVLEQIGDFDSWYQYEN